MNIMSCRTQYQTASIVISSVCIAGSDVQFYNLLAYNANYISSVLKYRKGSVTQHNNKYKTQIHLQTLINRDFTLGKTFTLNVYFLL